MTDHKTNLKAQSGNAAVIVLVILVIAAVGVLAFTSGKIGGVKNDDATVAAGEAGTSADMNQTLAKVDGDAITRGDVLKLISTLPPQMRHASDEQLIPMALDQMIANTIVDSKAKSSNTDRDPAVKKQLADLKKQIVRAKFIENAVKDELNEERLRKEYETYLANFPKVEEVKASHILVKDLSAAKKLITRLGKGASFETLAQENSIDGTAQNGGALGYLAKSEVVPEFAEGAFAIKVGEYTKKPVKSEFGYHVIKIEDKRIRPAADFEQAKPYIEQELRNQVLQELLISWRENADIVLYDENGEPVKTPAVPAAAPEVAVPAAPEAAPAPEAAAE